MSRMQTIACCWIAWVSLQIAGAAAEENRPPFEVTTNRDTAKVEFNVEKDKTVFSVHSPDGIGEAKIERTNENWPKQVMLRLYLQGLESFRASNGTVTLDAAVTSHGDRPRARLWKDGKENSSLDSSSPFWMEILAIGGDDKPAQEIPLKDGYFALQLPEAFFAGNPKSITLKWIDFYRN